MPRPPRDRHNTGNQKERNPAHLHGPRKMKPDQEAPESPTRKSGSARDRDH